jgi:hypothetical protein
MKSGGREKKRLPRKKRQPHRKFESNLLSNTGDESVSTYTWTIV